MITLNVEDRTGKAHAIETSTDATLMEAIRDYGLTDEFALCGGHCSCATCHVIVEAAFAPQVGTPSADESALLDGSDHREAGSRLACQVPLAMTLDGMAVRIAPID